MLFTGKFFLLLGPSGVGKGTVITALKKKFQDDDLLVFPVTATTRNPRPKEKNGKDYYFLSREEFEEKIKKNEFIEHAIVHQKNYYGLPKEHVFEALKSGKNVIRELDIQGLWNLQKIIPKENLVSIFLLPQSLEILEKRIRGRSNLPDEEIERRLKTAQNEITHADECDVQIVSEDGKIGKMVEDVMEVISKKN